MPLDYAIPLPVAVIFCNSSALPQWRRQLDETGVDENKFSRPSDSGKAFLIFFIYFEIFGQAPSSTSFFRNGGFFASAKIEIKARSFPTLKVLQNIRGQRGTPSADPLILGFCLV